ncbi:metabolite transport protein YfiG [Apiospora sp. TS-2023a]
MRTNDELPAEDYDDVVSDVSSPTSAIENPQRHVQTPIQASILQDFTKQYGLSKYHELFEKASILVQGDVPVDEIPNITASELDALELETDRKWRQPKALYFTILVCSIGAIEQGWAQASMNGANLYFPKEFGIGSSDFEDTLLVGLINSAIYLSTALIGAWLSEPLNHRFGRRGAVFSGALLCLFSNIASALSRSWLQLLLFRVVVGIGLGVGASTVSIFAAECAPPSIRGGLAVSWQMWVAFGVFAGFLANVAFFSFGDMTWRLQLVAPALPVIPLASLVFQCPESPAWLMKKMRYAAAFESLCRLRNSKLQAAREVYAAYILSKTSRNDPATKPSFGKQFLELYSVPRIRRATLASFSVMISQQLCGINIVSFYSSSIFLDAGFSRFGALLASVLFGLVNFLGAFPAIWTMDTLGRRSLLLLTLPLMALTMFCAGLTFSIPADNLAHFGLLAVLIYLFCALYSPGMGPMPNSYSAEVFPLSHRELGMALAVATTNFWAAVLSLTFPRLETALGTQGAFILYAFLNLVAFVLVFLFVPETRQKGLDELDDVFSIRTRTFARYQVVEYSPWWARRYILRQDIEEPKPLHSEVEYRTLLQRDGEEP